MSTRVFARPAGNFAERDGEGNGNGNGGRDGEVGGERAGAGVQPPASAHTVVVFDAVSSRSATTGTSYAASAVNRSRGR